MKVEQHINRDFRKALSDAGFPSKPELIINRVVQFTSAYRDDQGEDGVDLLKADLREKEAKDVTPLIFVAIVIGVSYDSFCNYIRIHLHPIAIDQGTFNTIHMNDDSAGFVFMDEGSPEKKKMLGAVKLL